MQRAGRTARRDETAAVCLPMLSEARSPSPVTLALARDYSVGLTTGKLPLALRGFLLHRAFHFMAGAWLLSPGQAVLALQDCIIHGGHCWRMAAGSAMASEPWMIDYLCCCRKQTGT